MIEKIKMLIRAWHYRLQENPNEIAFILKHAHAGDTLFDIGSNKGGFLYWMIQKAGKQGKVVGFEPQRVLSEYLTSYYSERHEPAISIESDALSDKVKEATMIIPENGKPSAPGASIHFIPEADSTMRTATVHTTTLDLYCSQKNLVPKLVKIDVEGHELNVIRGGRQVLQTYKPKIILECEAMQVGKDTVQETFDELLAMGYNGYFFYKGNRTDIRYFVAEQHQPAKFTGKKSNEYCSNFFFM